MPRTSLALAAALISSLTACADLRDAINPYAPRTATREEAARNVAFTCTHTSLRHTAYCAKYDASPEGLALAAKEREAQEAALTAAPAQAGVGARAWNDATDNPYAAGPSPISDAGSAETRALAATPEGRAEAARGALVWSPYRSDPAKAAHADTPEGRAALTACLLDGKISACIALPDAAAKKACASQCMNVREEAMNASAQQEQAACESRYIEADGRNKAACSLPGAVPNLDVVKLKNDLAGAWAGFAAGTAHDGAAFDDAIKRSDGQFLDELQTDCTKACMERARNLLAVQKQGPSLVTAYKRCMVDADSGHEARKLAVYETDLYCDYIQKADARCRTASRCDWIEQFSSTTCTYNSPLFALAGRCQ